MRGKVKGEEKRRVTSYGVEKPPVFIQEPGRAKIQRGIKNIISNNTFHLVSLDMIRNWFYFD